MKKIEWIWNRTIAKLFNVWLMQNIDKKYHFWKYEDFEFKIIKKK